MLICFKCVSPNKGEDPGFGERRVWCELVRQCFFSNQCVKQFVLPSQLINTISGLHSRTKMIEWQIWILERIWTIYFLKGGQDYATPVCCAEIGLQFFTSTSFVIILLSFKKNSINNTSFIVIIVHVEYIEYIEYIAFILRLISIDSKALNIESNDILGRVAKTVTHFICEFSSMTACDITCMLCCWEGSHHIRSEPSTISVRGPYLDVTEIIK